MQKNACLYALLCVVGCADGEIGETSIRQTDDSTPVHERQAKPDLSCGNPKAWFPALNDADRDGYYEVEPSAVTVSCTAPRYHTDRVDCDDHNKDVFLTRILYHDRDDDKFGSGTLYPVCVTHVDELPPLYSTKGSDCDDANAARYKLTKSENEFRDDDGDGVGTNSRCVGDTQRVSNKNNDCNDQHPQVIALEPMFLDGDGDGYGAGVQVMGCSQAPGVPQVGFSFNDTDCADDNRAYFKLTASPQEFLDADGDGWGSTSRCVGNASKISSNNWDCNDADPVYKWWRGDLYGDGDGDRYGVGAKRGVCTQNGEVPSGYSDNNADCNDQDPNLKVWRSDLFYDRDLDHFGGDEAAPMVCTNGDPPSGYASNSDDCFDQDFDVNPNQSNYFTVASKAGNYDYNCRNGDEKKSNNRASYCSYLGWQICRLWNAGFVNSVPACGQQGDWAYNCRYDGISCRYMTSRVTQSCK